MSKNGDVLYIVMPAYNEADNIEQTIKSWYPILKDKSPASRLVIADSGSTDDTHKILTTLRKKYKQLEILSDTNQYHGPKVLALYQYAIKNKADFIFQTDSDGQTNPKEFATFWQLRDKHDAILGYRSVRGDGQSRALVEKVVCFLLKLFFDVKVPDANAPFRLMKTSLVAKYIKKFPADYGIPNIIFTAYFSRFKENIIFKEISFKPRTAGKNSINIKKIFSIGWQSLKDFYNFRKDIKKHDPKITQEIRRRKFGTAAIAATFFAATILLTMVSPSHPWNNAETVTDSGVFMTVGTQMKSGLIPYRDTFDHKGPIIYIINYFGVLIHEHHGIIIMECLAILFTLIFMYKIARLKIQNRFFAVFVTLVAITLYANLNLIDKGNLTEEYAMPFIAASLYIFIKYFISGKTSFASVLSVGVCFACVALLRINMAVMWAIFCLSILIKLIIEKSWRKLWQYILAFFSGVLIIFAPIFIWLAVNGAFLDFIDCYIVFNIEYSTRLGSGIDTMTTIKYLLNFTLIIIPLLLSLYYMYAAKNKFLYITYSIAYVITLLSASISGQQFPHYGMVLAPFIVFPFATLLSELEVDYRPVAVVFLILLSYIIYPAWLDLFINAARAYDHREIGLGIETSLSKPCEIVQELTDPTDRIAFYGNRGAIYLRCRRLPASRYSYQFPISRVRPEILDQYFAELKSNLPKIIITHPGHNDERIRAFTSEHGYKIEWSEPHEGGAVVYSRL